MSGVVQVGAFGRTVDIEVADRVALVRQRAQWSRCVVSDPVRPAALTVAYDADLPDDLAAYTVTSGVTLRFIEDCAGELLMLHAAGVADPRTGWVTALVAGSGTGKTTAAWRLCRDRFGYVTDETVAVRADGAVLPYPKPLSVITDGEQHKQQHGPDELGLLPAPGQLTLRRVVLLERDGVAGSTPRIEQVPLLDAVLALIPQLSYLTRMVEPLRTVVRQIQACGGVHRLHYAEIDLCGDLLRELSAAEPVQSADVRYPPPADQEPADAAPPSVPAAIRRGSCLDAVQIDDEILLLVQDTPIRCSGLGATVWLALQHPRPMADLIAICVAAHGEHPDARALVQAAVGELRQHHVLLRD